MKIINLFNKLKENDHLLIKEFYVRIDVSIKKKSF